MIHTLRFIQFLYEKKRGIWNHHESASPASTYTSEFIVCRFACHLQMFTCNLMSHEKPGSFFTMTTVAIKYSCYGYALLYCHNNEHCIKTWKTLPAWLCTLIKETTVQITWIAWKCLKCILTNHWMLFSLCVDYPKSSFSKDHCHLNVNFVLCIEITKKKNINTFHFIFVYQHSSWWQMSRNIYNRISLFVMICYFLKVCSCPLSLSHYQCSNTTLLCCWSYASCLCGGDTPL